MRFLIFSIAWLACSFAVSAQRGARQYVVVNHEAKYPSLKEALNYEGKIHHLEVFYPEQKTFPSTLMRFTKVDSFVFFLGNVNKWPDELRYFKKAKHIELWYPENPELPPQIAAMKNLESIRVVRLGEVEVPESWTRLYRLKSLFFAECNVLFPDPMYKLRALERLYLIKTEYEHLPDWIQGLPRLKEFVLINRGEIEIPKAITENADLKKKIEFLEPRKDKWR